MTLGFETDVGEADGWPPPCGYDWWIGLAFAIESKTNWRDRPESLLAFERDSAYCDFMLSNYFFLPDALYVE